MKYISSDTNVWLDFNEIDHLELPFLLPYIYLMEANSAEDELLKPEGLEGDLLRLGLEKTELTLEEYYLADELYDKYRKPSKYDCIALAIAKCREITLLSGDGPLRKAALKEGVNVIGTLGILEELYDDNHITKQQYLECLERLQEKNGGKVRLPAPILEERIEALK